MYRKLRALMPLVLLVGLALASVSDAALVGWWKFDDGSGEVAKDSSGKGYHGTITNPLWVAGHYGGALNFEGTSYVDAVSYTHLRAHETVLDLVCRLLLEKKKKTKIQKR